MPRALQRGETGSRSMNRLLGSQPSLGAAANGAVATEGLTGVNQTVIKLSSIVFALADVAGVVAFVGKKLYDFPAGVITILGVTANLAITKSSAGVNNDFDGDFSIGSVTAAGDATLTGAEADIVPSTPTPQAVAGATTAKGKSGAAPVQLDGSATAADLFLNLLVDDADHDVTTTPANLVVTGTITVLWAALGDY